MSSFVRRIQRALPRDKFYLKRGVMLGVTNPKAKDLIARLGREATKRSIAL